MCIRDRRYLDRIGLRDAVPPPPTLETLRRLQSAHLLLSLIHI